MATEEAIKNMPDVELVLSDGGLFPEKGRIQSISGVIDPTTGSVQVRATFPNKSNLLHSGSNGNIKIPVAYDNSIIIPQAATFELQDKVLVYKVVDGKAVSANIKVALENNGQEYIVTEGLQEGDIIIAEGAGLVREGTPVTIQNAN
jgi:membrane fusion protein (multidrug efflux system)